MDNASWNASGAVGAVDGSHGVDLWGVVMRRKWFLLLFTLLGAGLGYLHFLRQPAIFQSDAQVLVTNELRRNLPIEGIETTQGYEDNLFTQVILVRSPKVIEKAVHDHKLEELKSLQSSPDPAGTISSGLSAMPAAEGNSDVLLLSYRGTDPHDCATILSAICASYEAYLAESRHGISDETKQFIQKAKEELATKLNEKEAQYRRFRDQTDLLLKNGEGINIHYERLTQLEGARSEILIEKTETQAELEAIEAALAQGGSRDAIRLMITQDIGRQQRETLETDASQGELFPLLLQQEMLLQRLGPDHPKVKTLNKQIELTREFVKANAPMADDGVADERPDLLNVYVESLRQKLTAGDEKLARIDRLIESERKLAKQVAKYELENETLRNDISRTQQLFDVVVKRLEEINLIQDHTGGVEAQVISPPKGGWQVEPTFSRIMAVSLALGLFAGLGLGYLVEVTDKSFHSPEDITQELQLPVIGHIPMIRPAPRKLALANSKLDRMLSAYHRPKSQSAEAYRAIRTALYFNTRGSNHKLIQITSPDPGDGKSTLAASLAISIARSGKRVLLVDCDFRKPRVHKLLGIQRNVGISTVMAGKVELLDAIQATEVENMWALPCGPQPHNPSELLTSPQFKDLLDVLREKYDFVLFDTPPLLAVTDPSAVAARVDGVLLTLRLGKRTRHDALQAIELLNTVGATVLGTVVNGVPVSRRGYSAYRHGSSRYGYSGRYGRGYGSQDPENVYYSEEEASDPVRRNGSHSRNV